MIIIVSGKNHDIANKQGRLHVIVGQASSLGFYRVMVRIRANRRRSRRRRYIGHQHIGKTRQRGGSLGIVGDSRYDRVWADR